MGRAEENVEALQQQLADLEAAFKAEIEATATALSETIESKIMRPTKQNISVKLVALVWSPWWSTATGSKIPAWK